MERQFRNGDPARASGASVTFEPGARTVWHLHPLGQTLIVTSGTGWVQQWGESKQTIEAGDVVTIPPGVKHWHGATATTAMTHVAIQEELDGHTVEWMDAVSAELTGLGLGLADVVSATVYLTDIADYQAFNEVYPEIVPAPWPARTCVAVAALPGGARVEVQVIARR